MAFIKSALRMTAVKYLEKIDGLSVASFEFFLDFSRVFS